MLVDSNLADSIHDACYHILWLRTLFTRVLAKLGAYYSKYTSLKEVLAASEGSALGHHVSETCVSPSVDMCIVLFQTT